MAATTEVRIGDETVSIGKLPTYKVLRVGTLLTGLMREVPELSERMTSFQREYAATNTVRISRVAAELRYEPEQLERISEDAWEAADGWLELPASPSLMEVAANVLPLAWDEMHDRVLELLALLIVPTSRLRDAADDETKLKEVVAEQVRALMWIDADQLLDLAAAAAEVIEEQFEGKAESLRKVGGLFGLGRTTTETEPETETETVGTVSVKPNSTSLTDSDGPTDGDPTTGDGSPSSRSEALSSA